MDSLRAEGTGAVKNRSTAKAQRTQSMVGARINEVTNQIIGFKGNTFPPCSPCPCGEEVSDHDTLQ